MTTKLATSEMKRTSTIGRARPKFERWQRTGKRLVEKFRDSDNRLEATQWDIADWIFRGAKRFGKQKAYDAAQEITGFDRSYLQTVLWVAKRFRFSLRKETTLRWSHFKELAYIKNDNVRERVLGEFDDGHDYSVREVRERVRRELGKAEPTKRSSRSIGNIVFVRVPFKRQYRVRLKTLAKLRRTTPDVLVRKIVEEYFKQNKKEIAAQLERSKRRRS